MSAIDEEAAYKVTITIEDRGASPVDAGKRNVTVSWTIDPMPVNPDDLKVTPAMVLFSQVMKLLKADGEAPVPNKSTSGLVHAKLAARKNGGLRRRKGGAK